MARAAVPGRLTWRVAELAETTDLTESARGLVFDVPGWPGHLPGQHVDVRLTAEDGYSVQRSYSISSAPGGDRVELAVQRVQDGEVSPYLCDVLVAGDRIELRGPVGGWFVWRAADPAPVTLVAGGSGIVPLMAMIRTRAAEGSRVPFRLVYSARTPDDVLFADELRRRAREDAGLDVKVVYTRQAPEGAPEPPGRLGVATLNTYGWPAEFTPNCFVCGPTGFVETVSDILVALGHDPRRVRTERFG
ncbi:Ferredoxin-NADP reductase [Lentzea xinjiangensis]|uniref:Ferredoxin-NADP reductase n=1 Tax=Lentzea xinjiangensis TaxID=402600 RepID=A0A1H9JS91_9PSEU|nr:ferredoxin reductase [Lentzea xinjiangensis]SEQ89664.1 Ferredoxin-NADP reductase [Lentzea xinjiangensis]